MADTTPEPEPRPEPLFSLDLGSNGGVFAPTSYSELREWVQKEQNVWLRVLPRNYGSHENLVRQGIEHLANALNHANQAESYRTTNPDHSRQQLQACNSRLTNAYIDTKLPHSSTPLGQRIQRFREANSELVTSYFVGTLLSADENVPLQPNQLAGWRGVIEALIERYNFATTVAKGRKQAADQSFEQLRTKAESLLGEKTDAFDGLHRSYSELAESVRTTSEAQTTSFKEAQTERQTAFEGLKKEHEAGMENLRKVFREEIALRAPAEYWSAKRKGHITMAWVTGIVSFLGMVAAAVGIGYEIHDLLSKTPAGTAPETWRLSVLVLIGLFTVWGLRLAVRMFLSHLHLLTDAGERVVMVQTYLSLMEGNQLADKDDRQLILQALFRPSSDGIVKDEGIPPSFLELLTRGSKP